MQSQFGKTMPHISIIAAIAANNAIGKDNQLLCHLPGDLKRFKDLTTNHTVIMGYKTFLSLPNGALPNRKNIVLSRSITQIENCLVVDSLEKALKLCSDEQEVFVIGGGILYHQCLPLADKLYLTHIHAELNGDTFFPDIDYTQWNEIYREERGFSVKCPHSYAFVNYIRK